MFALSSHSNTNVSKFELLYEYVNNTDPLMIGVVETWLDHSIPMSDVSLPGYKCFRNDRDSLGGGCAFYVKESVPSVEVARRNDLKSECLFMNVLLPNIGNTLFAVCYRSEEPVRSFLDNLQTTLED
ncbi:unnamed protein product, partial [Didymodactylos carnosus]